MDIVVEQILSGYDTITVVGASADPAKAAHLVPALMQRHGWAVCASTRPLMGTFADRARAPAPHSVGNPANARGSGLGSSASMHARTCRR
jgi:hypothetical protein